MPRNGLVAAAVGNPCALSRQTLAEMTRPRPITPGRRRGGPVAYLRSVIKAFAPNLRMADDKSKAKASEDASEGWSPQRGWRDLWQAPALVLGAVLLVAGLISSITSAPSHDFEGALDDVQALIQQEEYEVALDRLNREILPHLISTKDVSVKTRSRFHLLRGDAIYLAQAARSGNERGNDRAVIEEFDQAQKLLVELGPERIARYASSLVALGREDEAIKRVRELPVESAAVRHDLVRRIIERSLATPAGSNEKALELLGELNADPTLNEEYRVWVIVTQARLRLEAGLVGEAIDHMLLALQRNRWMSGTDAARLYVLLGRAYEELGQLADAERNINRAAERLSPSDRLMGEVHLVAGRIAQDRGSLEQARNAYSQIVTDFAAAESWMEGLLGLAETQAMLGELVESQGIYAQLSDELGDRGEQPNISRRIVAESLLDQVSGALAREDYSSALQFAELARNLYRSDRAPAAVSLALARSQRLLADETLATARHTPADPPDPSLLDPVTRAQVRAHFHDAGEHYLAHARDMILADDESFADSLWNAGECFDLAGDLDKAIEVFSEYANGRPTDARRPAAVFKLAQAHQARGEYATAAEFFRELIAENPNSGEGTRSLVWLARTFLQDDDPDNDSEAKRLLERVVDGGLLAPQALDFRLALIDLGRSHYHRRENEPAIRRLDEAVRRFTDDREIHALRFELADSHRRRSEELAASLNEAMPEAQRRRLEQQRTDHLTEAMRLFEMVRASLQEEDTRRLSSVQRSYLRNAYFYKADCAFDLQQYDRAIEFYDTAAQRFAEEPVSLVAMAQIVSAFIEQGRFVEARKANERARLRLNEFPDSSFDSSDLPFTRKHWERWLDSTDALSGTDESGATRTATAPTES